MRMRAALHQDRDGTHGRRWVSNSTDARCPAVS